MNNASPECLFLWFIENYSFCTHKNGESLVSPEFTANSLEGAVWCLSLYPRGYKEESKGYISLYLTRRETDDGPGQFPLKFELSILLADGSDLQSGTVEYTFEKGNGFGCHQFLKREEVLLRRKAVCLPQNILSVRCKIWKNEGKTEPVAQICARTRLGIKEISFLHIVEGFGAFKPNEKKTTQIRSSKETPVLSSSLYFSDDSWSEGEIVVEIKPPDTNHVLSKCKLSLLDRSGKATECGEADNRFDETRQDIQKLPLSLRRQVILNRESKYLPDDKLTLLCECTFSTGVEYEKTEKILHEIPFAALNQINNNGQNEAAEKLSVFPSVVDDLKEIYSKQLLTDVELKTKTKSFPAHKIVLCGRSPVFKAMMTNDMKEKNNNFIQVEDLEDDIVQQLLLFLYSDNLETLQWESAIKLYYAGDKYDIGKLKVMCSSFLVENLTTSTASELLLLADTHSDSDLKKAVEDFIFNHEEEVFGSDEWGSLIETNPLLVSKTMRLKYTRKI
ncbi:Speckle-type POZ protein [Araneus ventricosus]|uniref:Speckle-type POZ protein n=1 Tax=Araneus ventricosus TaxID=182803 RepID=A0A4Y2LKG7_ARAVE|nr:Speckle-type POZ protein [Araneus ventricosus]